MSTNTTTKSRLGICTVCKTGLGKYTCPACGMISCSLPCTKKHKEDDKCDGIRSRTAYIKFQQISNLDVFNDYRLLEELATRLVSCEKARLNAPHLDTVSLKMQKLRLAFHQRGGRLVFLPLEFHQRKVNTSYFDHQAKTISWHIQLHFLNAGKFSINQTSCSEDMILGDLIEKYLVESARFPESVSQKLLSYRIAGIDQITVLLKAEKVPLSDSKFYKLDPSKTIKENLVGKILVEFPQLYLLINGFFKTEKTKLLQGGEKILEKNKNLLMSNEDQDDNDECPSEIPLKRAKRELPSTPTPCLDNSSSDSASDDEWDDTERFFIPWYNGPKPSSSSSVSDSSELQSSVLEIK